MKMNCDDRGSFTELVHTVDCGQVSINISKPGITKGQHWHNSKWEQFIVVHGHGLIQERNINTGETVEFEVSGDKIEARISHYFKSVLVALYLRQEDSRKVMRFFHF